jgi:hypothetical protein
MLDNIPNEVHSGIVRRSNMPQIDFMKFLKYMNDNLIPWSYTEIHPGHLKSSQGDFSDEKIEAIKRSNEYIIPIFVTSDLFVLDGHHRWLAQLDKDAIEIIKIDLMLDDAMEACKKCSTFAN